MYQKEFTRDFSIIMEEAWHSAIFKGLPKLLKIPVPSSEPLVFYLHQGFLEVWSDKKIIATLEKQINKKSKQNPRFILDILSDYEKQLKYFSPFFKAGKTNNIVSLVGFVKLIYKTIASFALMYYIADQSLGAKEVVAKAKALRQKDSFYEDCDRYIRKSLLLIYPQLKGRENTVLVNELRRLPRLEILANRRHGFVLVPGKIKKAISLFNFSQDNKSFKFQFVKFDASAKIIKGQAAFLGKVKGRVRLVFSKEQIKTVKKGEILVTHMTTPSYLPAMKKAAAFVTDEGGTLCHAAIIARELKKPCLIGTKFATEILSSGELVEVDTRSAYVRRLSK